MCSPSTSSSIPTSRWLSPYRTSPSPPTNILPYWDWLRTTHLLYYSKLLPLVVLLPICLQPFIPTVGAGCYRPVYHPPFDGESPWPVHRQPSVRLCCVGRNSSCKSKEDRPTPRRNEALHRPATLPSMSLVRKSEAPALPVYEAGTYKRVGRMILPGTIELNEWGEAVSQLAGQHEFPFRVYTMPSMAHHINKSPPVRRRRKRHNGGTRRQREEDKYELDTLIFGAPLEDPPMPELKIYPAEHGGPGGRPLIRYALLNKYLPLRVGKAKRKGSTSRTEWLRIAYVGEAPYHPDCYCDEQCLLYGDCCSDYAQVCPQPEHCIVSEWGGWSQCLPTAGECGEGERIRERTVLREPSHGGAACPSGAGLREMRACFKECSRPSQADAFGRRMPSSRGEEDTTTVALLLDYKYHQARSAPPLGVANETAYRWWESAVEKRMRFPKDQYKSYCVHYELGWVNRNCVERKWKSVLYKHALICAECQPEAQFHRPRARCASDLEDGEKGFWKLVGPPSCNGIWRRLGSEKNCKCGAKFPDMTPFLLV